MREDAGEVETSGRETQDTEAEKRDAGEEGSRAGAEAEAGAGTEVGTGAETNLALIAEPSSLGGFCLNS